MKHFAWVAALLVGCGGDDGVSDSKRLADLSTSEASDVCNGLVEAYPKRTVQCVGFSFPVGYSADDCLDQDPAAPACTATVGDLRECAEVMYNKTDEQLCMDEAVPAACMRAEAAGC